jgi:hypothetical protein
MLQSPNNGQISYPEIRASLRSHVRVSRSETTPDRIAELVSTQGEDYALAHLVAPWLIPFVDWDALRKIISCPDHHKTESESTKNARILLHHLCKQKLDFLIRERGELHDSLVLAIGNLPTQFIERALKQALTYPSLEESQRVDVLVMLSEAISQNEVFTRDQEDELIDIYETILKLNGNFRYAKGVAADRLGLLFKKFCIHSTASCLSPCTFIHD